MGKGRVNEKRRGRQGKAETQQLEVGLGLRLAPAPFEAPLQKEGPWKGNRQGGACGSLLAGLPEAGLPIWPKDAEPLPVQRTYWRQMVGHCGGKGAGSEEHTLA